jgi:hypothetical protein
MEAVMPTTEPLTEREQWALGQIREAQEQGATLKAHGAKIGIDVVQLYELRRRLIRKGAFGAVPPRKVRKPGKPGDFVPVRVIPSKTVQNGSPVACRLLHPGGCWSASDCLRRRGLRRCWREVRMLRPSAADLKVYLHRAPIDMRAGRNGLAAIAREVIIRIASRNFVTGCLKDNVTRRLSCFVL